MFTRARLKALESLQIRNLLCFQSANNDSQCGKMAVYDYQYKCCWAVYSLW